MPGFPGPKGKKSTFFRIPTKKIISISHLLFESFGLVLLLLVDGHFFFFLLLLRLPDGAAYDPPSGDAVELCWPSSVPPPPAAAAVTGVHLQGGVGH